MKSETFKTLILVFAGPILALLLLLSGVVLAPPNQGFSTIAYLPLCGLGIPICLVLMAQKKLLGWKLWTGVIASVFVPLFLFILAAPVLPLPSGMSNCKSVSSSTFVVKYDCIDNSSDDASYHREFTVVGFKGWPVMRIIKK
jgi:hypothetical protein